MLGTKKFEATIGEHAIVVETGKLAQQAGGAVTIRCGDTVLFTAATMSRSVREGIDFFPLTVDYEAGCTQPGVSPARSIAGRDGRERMRSSPHASPTGRCGRFSPRECATKFKS
jgi:polyribonucleotide nucleotidyltransferase